MSPAEVSTDWRSAIRLAADAKNVCVVGAADVGKSSFIRSVLAERDCTRQLVDLDPGQKMVGPPGTVTLGHAAAGELQLDRLFFVGSTSAAELGQLLKGARALCAHMGADRNLIVNTSGFVRGLGARLQSLTIAAVEPDLVIAIQARDELELLLPNLGTVPVCRVAPSPLVRRKTSHERLRARQIAFDDALAGSEHISILRPFPISPAAVVHIEGPHRPVCAYTNQDGIDLGLGILDHVGEDRIRLVARTPGQPISMLKLGKMWAERDGEGWRLSKRLHPSWA